MLLRTILPKNINVAVVILDNTLLSSAVGLMDIFNLNNGFCKKECDANLITTFVSSSHKNQSSSVSLTCKALNKQNNYDIIILPPLTTTNNLIHVDNELNSWLIYMYHKGVLLTSVCAGSFILAHTGLLDYKKATTHWAYEELFEKSFNKIDLVCEQMLVDEGQLITAGGMSAYVDLALYLIEGHISKESAQTCANLLLVERGRDSQRSYKNLTTTLLIEDEEIKKLLLWSKNNLHKNIGIKELAHKINMQERSFLRRFKKVVNTTPNQYLQNLRIEEAKNLLINSAKSFDLITSEVGFFNESSFRRLFKKETSLTPSQYRKKFQYA